MSDIKARLDEVLALAQSEPVKITQESGNAAIILS
jgi:hypothetical protein